MLSGQRKTIIQIRSCRFVWRVLALGALALSPVVGRADTVYVWSEDGSIQAFDSNGVASVVSTNFPGWNGPVGLALDNFGNLYAGCPDNSSIWKFATDGTSVQVGYIDSVSGLAFDPIGSLYATIPNYAEIVNLGAGPGYELPYPSNYSQSHLGFPIGLAMDSAGNILVANSVPPSSFFFSGFTNTIEKFSPDCTYLGNFASGLNQPWGLAFDRNGNLYVSESGTNQIRMFPSIGAGFVLNSISHSLSNPRGLAFDSAGNLYVANAGNGAVVAFTPTCSGCVFASNLAAPSSIAIWPGLMRRVSPPNLLPGKSSGEAMQIAFTNLAGMSFTVLSSTNVSLPAGNWTVSGPATEISSGLYHFVDLQATNGGQQFYRVRAP